MRSGPKLILALGLLLAACGTFLDVGGDDEPAVVATADAGAPAPQDTDQSAPPVEDAAPPPVDSPVDECAGVRAGTPCMNGVCYPDAGCKARLRITEACEATWQCNEQSVCDPASGQCERGFGATCSATAPGDAELPGGFVPVDAGECAAGGCCLGLNCGKAKQGLTPPACHQCGVTGMPCPTNFREVGCCPGYECSSPTQTCVRGDAGLSAGLTPP